MSQFVGTVKWFNNAKGYGFIGRDQGADVFVHYTCIKSEGYKSLKEGDLVSFNVAQGTQGPQAESVMRLDQGGTGVIASSGGAESPAMATI